MNASSNRETFKSFIRKRGKNNKGGRVLQFNEEERKSFLLGFRQRKRDRRLAVVEKLEDEIKNGKKHVKVIRRQRYMPELDRLNSLASQFDSLVDGCASSQQFTVGASEITVREFDLNQHISETTYYQGNNDIDRPVLSLDLLQKKQKQLDHLKQILKNPSKKRRRRQTMKRSGGRKSKKHAKSNK
ncbi:hypothetical protein GJ496_000449 [Pomphorhynchus laevis]|nr:hypothetical protein GJ496_000449 [Pomphorhynchus laevis]